MMAAFHACNYCTVVQALRTDINSRVALTSYFGRLQTLNLKTANYVCKYSLI